MPRVSVNVYTGHADMDFDRSEPDTMSDGDGIRFREAAKMLRRIADDIDRMYPKPTNLDDRLWGSGVQVIAGPKPPAAS